MTVNATVPGAGTGTITIPFSSQARADYVSSVFVRQIRSDVGSIVLQVVDYPGSGPAPAVTALQYSGLVIHGARRADLGTLPANYEYLVADGAATLRGEPAITFVNGSAWRLSIVSNTAGVALDNPGGNIGMVVAGGTNLIAQSGASASLYMQVDGGDTHAMVTGGAASIMATSDAAIQVGAGAAGRVVVDAYGDNNLINVVGANTTGNAVTVSGMPEGGTTQNLSVIGTAGTYTDIYAGADNVTIAANSGEFTLHGGHDVLMFANHGSITGGNGANYLITDSLAGATTLTALGTSNTLIGQGAGNTYNIGGGGGIIADLSGAGSDGGATYSTEGGEATVMGAIAANSTFNFGLGTALAYGQHGAHLDRGNVYTDAYDGANAITIGDFVQGLDVFSLSGSGSGASLSSIHYYDSASTSAFGAVGTQAILSDGTRIDFLGFNISASAFV